LVFHSFPLINYGGDSAILKIKFYFVRRPRRGPGCDTSHVTPGVTKVESSSPELQLIRNNYIALWNNFELTEFYTNKINKNQTPK